jgi:ABC-type multidrug transport system ATPase subunit
MTSKEELIRLEAIGKRYGHQSVLQIDRLAFYEGDRIILTGPNGSGKSTLLKLLAGVAPVDGGRICWARDLRDCVVGYVPQSGGLYGDLTVEENLHVRLGLHGMKPTDLRRLRHVRTLGLLSVLGKRFAELSGGYQRLATIAAALVVEPAWLLLDEPFSGMDQHFQGVVSRQLADPQRRTRLSVLAAPTPDPHLEVNRVIEIENGRIACSAR